LGTKPSSFKDEALKIDFVIPRRPFFGDHNRPRRQGCEARRSRLTLTGQVAGVIENGQATGIEINRDYPQFVG